MSKYSSFRLACRTAVLTIGLCATEAHAADLRIGTQNLPTRDPQFLLLDCNFPTTSTYQR